jgi:hypothetical protein
VNLLASTAAIEVAGVDERADESTRPQAAQAVHVDTLDLYQARPRATFVKAAVGRARRGRRDHQSAMWAKVAPGVGGGTGKTDLRCACSRKSRRCVQVPRAKPTRVRWQLLHEPETW